MVSYRAFGPVLLLAALSSPPSISMAQSPDVLAGVQKELVSLYPTAKATADGTDLVTAGAVLVLQKDHLLMSNVNQPVAVPNQYKDGAITGLAGKRALLKALGTLSKLPGLGGLNPLSGNAAAASAADAAAATREFVTGEKFWVTNIDTEPDGVTFSVLSDPIKDQRYHATLKFPFTKAAATTPDDVAALVSEVLKIDAPAAQAAAPPDAPALVASAAPAAPVQTKTIAIGQTRDQVIATFGVPAKIVHLGEKEIDFYPDMKVTFDKSVVTDVN
jgi:hypothetical protein